jgi:hypothetical protein
MRGAQYLHKSIPGLPRYEIKVTYTLIGSVEEYRRKVYGPHSTVEVSPEALRGIRPAWDIRAVYDALWASYGDLVHEWEAGPGMLDLATAAILPDLVISTIPAKLLCEKPAHEFRSTSVLISEDARWILPWQDNKVVCSGRENHPWYRQSRILGHSNTEYPYPVRTPFDPVAAKIVKPIATDCDCHRSVIRMGRYGRWEKKVLSHTAYFETRGLLA